MPMTFDIKRAQTLSGGVHALLAPRTDVPDAARCFAVLHPHNPTIVLGRVQIFSDGTAGYWREDGEQAKLVATVEVAVRRLLDAAIEDVLKG